MDKIKVLIVDDSSFVRRALLRIFAEDPAIDVVGIARTGTEAIEKAVAMEPDVITLDIHMPGMDGLETLKILMEQRPVPVLMLSQFTKQGAELTLRALELGAMDFVDKSSAGLMDFFDLAREIISKVKSIAGSRPVRIGPHQPAFSSIRTRGLIDVVAIGTSTGGPMALQMLLPKFPKDISFAVLVVQHMPQGFTGPLARRLDTACAIYVKEAVGGERVLPGVSFIAPAGMHMTVRKAGLSVIADEGEGREVKTKIKLMADSLGEAHRPSVDVLFRSVAETYGSRAIGVILTGMGSDGVKGLKAMREAGCFTLAQDEATSAIFGMPRVAIENQAVDKVLPITSMGEEILSRA